MARFLVFILVLFSAIGFSQDCDSTDWAQPGTYNVSIDSLAFEGQINSMIMLSGDDLCFIETKREYAQSVFIHIGIYLIEIFPKSFEEEKY